MEPEEHTDSIRLPLDCARPCEPVPCAACQHSSLDTNAAHATCSVVGKVTRGHNAVTTLVHAIAQSCDCTAEMESSLALTCVLRMFSPMHRATPAPPSISRSALRTHNRLVLIARRPDTMPNSPTMGTPIVWSAYGRLIVTR